MVRCLGWLSVVSAIVSCSLQQPQVTRLSPPAPFPQTHAQSADAESPVHPTVISLDALRPMSTRPNFAAIAQAVELGAEHRAVEFIATQLRADDASIPELQRKHLWLGYAYRKHDNVVQALFHFEAASSVDWPLAGYARFGAAESLVALGRPDEALRRLVELKASEPLASAGELLRAKILAQTGRASQSIPIWRAYLAHAPSSEPERGQISMTLAETLVALSSARQRPTSTSFQEPEPAVSADAFQQEAFELLDPLKNKGLDADAQQRAVELRQSLISSVFAGQPNQQQQCRLSDRLNELEALVEQHTEALTTVAQLDHGTEAALAREQAEHEAERAAELAERYLAERAAAVLLTRAIEHHREHSATPILERAQQLLPKLTGNSLTRLFVDDNDGDHPVLMARRASGGELGVSAMSDGTLDQLYLALRLAALEHHLDALPPLPVLLDDILVNYDDPRVTSTVPALAEIAQRTQVIVLTHHQHVAAIAQDTLGDRVRVHRLGGS